MKFSTTAIVLAAALGATAHPSGHGHQQAHRSIEQRDGAKFVMNVKPEPTTKAAPKPKPTAVVNAAVAEPPKEKSKPAPKPKAPKKEPSPPKGGAGSTGLGISSYQSFCGGKKRATQADIFYTGNVGVAGDYGCNLMLAQKSAAQKYDYKMQLKNVGGKDASCTCFLKIGPDGGVNGFWKDNQVLDFKLPVGGEQWVVADEDTQGSCSCAYAPQMQYTAIGETAGTWAEFDFNSKVNNGWSGADASILTATRAGMSHPGMRICAEGSGSPCSIVHADGTGSNSFTKGMEAEDGWGINATPGPLTLKIEVGYQG